MSKDTYWLTVEVRKETEKAVLVHDADVTTWIPKSQIIDADIDFEIGKLVEIELPAWLAEEKGFIA